MKNIVEDTTEGKDDDNANNSMKEFEKEGIKCLDSIPESDAKKALLMLLNYTIVREY